MSSEVNIDGYTEFLYWFLTIHGTSGLFSTVKVFVEPALYSHFSQIRIIIERILVGF